MIHVEDVASLVKTILEQGTVGILIGDDGQRYSPRKIQERVREELGFSDWTVSLPAGPVLVAAALVRRGKRLTVLRRLEADLSRFLDASLFDGARRRRELRWQAERTLWSELGQSLSEMKEELRPMDGDS